MKILGGRRIFIAHGHDELNRIALRKLLEEKGYNPVVLIEKRNEGIYALIEKFERNAKECNYAIVMFSPDDKHWDNASREDVFHARQNVLIELGWFMNSLGRSNVLAIIRGEVQIPSDVLGIEALKYSVSIEECRDGILRFLEGEPGD